MSVIKPEVMRLQHFFRSGPMPCPYLQGHLERKLFTRLAGPDAAAVNSVLSQAGFRRSHDIVYRPVCPGCNACVPVRIVVPGFMPDRTMRRILRANADLALAERPAQATAEQYRLFLRYQQTRHGDSDMARMARSDYQAMVEEGSAAARLFEFRDGDGRLVGGMLADRLTDGFSAVYSFYEPQDPRRSLGTFMVMALVDLACREDRAHVYLGYWIAQSRKMAYKARFRPIEALTEDGWKTLTESVGATGPGRS